MKVRQRLWWVLGGVFLLFCVGFVFATNRFDWSTTGFLKKSLWDWLQLLFVPLMLAVVALVFQLANSRTERQVAKQRYEQDQQITLDKQRGDLLQAYLDRMSELLLEKGLATKPTEEARDARNLARVLTITTLSQLDARRIEHVFTFLRASELMFTKPNSSIVSLEHADLKKINFSHVNLSEADLRGADLREANLRKANLSGANLGEADLRKAYLRDADLREANLNRANLSAANLIGAHLEGAHLEEAHLEGARLAGRMSKVNLSGADLSGADLSVAYFTEVDHKVYISVALNGANLSGANLKGPDLRGAKLRKANPDGTYLGNAKVTPKLETSAKGEASLRQPNPDEKYAHHQPPGRLRGPMRTFGGPLRLSCKVTYARDEETVRYIQRSKLVLIGNLLVPLLILLILIVSIVYFPLLRLAIAIAIFVMLLVIAYTIISYIDDVYILTTKRIIDINRKFIFFEKEHLSIEYGQITDVKEIVGNPIYSALDVGKIIFEAPGVSPDIILDLVDHPISIIDMLFMIFKQQGTSEEQQNENTR